MSFEDLHPASAAGAQAAAGKFHSAAAQDILQQRSAFNFQGRAQGNQLNADFFRSVAVVIRHVVSMCNSLVVTSKFARKKQQVR